jgi:hypothetical protein
VDDEQNLRANQSNRLPPVAVRVLIKAAHGQRVAEYELRRLKTKPVMVALVRSIFLV